MFPKMKNTYIVVIAGNHVPIRNLVANTITRLIRIKVPVLFGAPRARRPSKLGIAVVLAPQDVQVALAASAGTAPHKILLRLVFLFSLLVGMNALKGIEKGDINYYRSHLFVV